MDNPRHNELKQARETSGLSVIELWVRYFGLGGMSSPLQFEALLHGALKPTAFERNQIVHALNERLAELGLEQRLEYWAETPS